jgi:hypothetical protein
MNATTLSAVEPNTHDIPKDTPRGTVQVMLQLDADSHLVTPEFLGALHRHSTRLRSKAHAHRAFKRSGFSADRCPARIFSPSVFHEALLVRVRSRALAGDVLTYTARHRALSGAALFCCFVEDHA